MQLEDYFDFLSPDDIRIHGHRISIESVLQKKAAAASGAVPILLFTHPARESAVRRALATIDRLPEIAAPTRLLRIEEDL